MNMVTGMPEAAWCLARLATASPSPPVRAYGDSSGTRCTTGAGVPSGRVNGADGMLTTGAAGISVFRVRLVRRGLTGLWAAGDATPGGERGARVAPSGAICSAGATAPDLSLGATISIGGMTIRDIVRV